MKADSVEIIVDNQMSNVFLTIKLKVYMAAKRRKKHKE